MSARDPWHAFPDARSGGSNADLTADNREDLAECLIKLAAESSRELPPGAQLPPLLQLTAACGRVFIWHTAADLPAESFRCPCGCGPLITYRETIPR